MLVELRVSFISKNGISIIITAIASFLPVNTDLDIEVVFLVVLTWRSQITFFVLGRTKRSFSNQSKVWLMFHLDRYRTSSTRSQQETYLAKQPLSGWDIWRGRWRAVKTIPWLVTTPALDEGCEWTVGSTLPLAAMLDIWCAHIVQCDRLVNEWSQITDAAAAIVSEAQARSSTLLPSSEQSITSLKHCANYQVLGAGFKLIWHYMKRFKSTLTWYLPIVFMISLFLLISQ